MSEKKSDSSIAETIQRQMGNNPEVEQVIVRGELLQIYVTENMYNRLAVDRERGRKIVLTLMGIMKDLTGLSEVTVWVYCKKDKVIEGKVKPWGGDNVNYFYDL